MITTLKEGLFLLIKAFEYVKSQYVGERFEFYLENN